MLSKIQCECILPRRCGGFLTTTELKMHELHPEFTAQHYHEVLDLFEYAFEVDEED